MLGLMVGSIDGRDDGDLDGMMIGSIDGLIDG
jgi:hypothetical protein